MCAVSVHLKIITKHTARSGLSYVFYKASRFILYFETFIYFRHIKVKSEVVYLYSTFSMAI